jgi:hypothetical protein
MLNKWMNAYNLYEKYRLKQDVAKETIKNKLKVLSLFYLSVMLNIGQCYTDFMYFFCRLSLISFFNVSVVAFLF